MNNEKQAGSFGLGIGLTVGGTFFLAAFITCLLLGFPYSEADSGKIAALVSLAIGVIVSYSWGIYELRRAFIGKKVAEKGKIGTCVVEKFEVSRLRGRLLLWMTVSFIDDFGKEQHYSMGVHDETVNTLNKGTVLECRILGNECYLDPDNIKVIKGAETNGQ